MRKNPASFDFYPDDFIAGTVDMTAIQVGMYIRSICYLFAKATLPADPSKLQLILGVCGDEFDDNWPSVRAKFVEDDDGNLFNERLQVEREKAVRIRRFRAEAGKKGGVAKATNLLKQKGSNRKKEEGRSCAADLDSKRSVKFSAERAELPFADPDFASAWQDWCKFRKDKRAPLTEETVKRNLKKFQKWGLERSISALDYTMDKGWTGLQEPDETAGSNGKPRKTVKELLNVESWPTK